MRSKVTRAFLFVQYTRSLIFCNKQELYFINYTVIVVYTGANRVLNIIGTGAQGETIVYAVCSLRSMYC